MREQINTELADVILTEERYPTTPIPTLLRSYDQAARERVPAGLSAVLTTVMYVETPADIVARIGWMMRRGIPTPLSIYIEGDPRNNRECRVVIEEGRPGIGIPEYWWDVKYAEMRRQYKNYIEKLAELLGLPAITAGYRAESEFAEVFPTYSERKVSIDTLTWAELRDTYRHIDWEGLLREVGVTTPTAMRYNITCRGFLHHLQRRLTVWPVERWRAWLGLMVAQWAAGCVPGVLREPWFAFNRRYKQGLTADETPARLRQAIVSTMMPHLLGRLWVERYCDPRLKTAVLRIVKQIQRATADALTRTEWMSPSTRTAAIRKLRQMEIEVAWPTEWPTLEGCRLSPTDYIHNLLELSAQESARNTRLKECRHPMGDFWPMPVYEVNAYYFPLENRFVLPAAILRPPFYDPRRSVPWNYGAIGATIGHEFCHAFDSQGRSYDEDGNVRSWWTRRDDREYRRRAAGVRRLFESAQYRGHDVDGELTEVENIADIGGLEFALAAAETEVGHPLTTAELREFFTSYAVSWRSKDRLRRAVQLLATDSHAPPMLRVNLIVRQMDAWYAAFGVGPECAGYIPPKKRIRFFGPVPVPVPVPVPSALQNQ